MPKQMYDSTEQQNSFFIVAAFFLFVLYLCIYNLRRDTEDFVASHVAQVGQTGESVRQAGKVRIVDNRQVMQRPQIAHLFWQIFQLVVVQIQPPQLSQFPNLYNTVLIQED